MGGSITKIGELNSRPFFTNGIDVVLDSRLVSFFDLSIAEFKKFLELSSQFDAFEPTEDFEKLIKNSEINCIRFQSFLKRKGLLEKYSPQLKKICGEEKKEKVVNAPQQLAVAG